MKTFTVLLLVVSSAFLVNAQQTTPTPQQVWVQGVVTDFLTGAPVPQATIIFETGTGGTISVWSRRDGSYFALVPVGAYRVAVQRMTYCSVRRAKANIGSDTRFDFRLPPCPTVHVGTQVDGRNAGEEAREVNPFKGAAFKLRSEFRLSYGTKQEDENSIDFHGTQLKHGVRDPKSNEVKDEYTFVSVMLSHETLTVYADTIKVAKKDFAIEAHGNVVIEDGGKRTTASAVKINLSGEKPVIDILR